MINEVGSNLEFLSRPQERENQINTIYQAALAERSEFQKIPEGEIKKAIQTAVDEIELLESAAHHQMDWSAAATKKMAEKVSAIWIFSGPGTYDDCNSASKVPLPYKKQEWMWGMDRTRISYGVYLMRKISEIKSGMEPASGPISETASRIRNSREIIANYGPDLIYNGSDVQNEAAFKEMENPSIVAPQNRVHILGKDLLNTVDQIKDIALPERLLKPGQEIALVSHAPHLMRILHILNRYKSIPEDVSVRLFPIATPPEGREKYKEMEIKGLLYYIFLSKDKDATLEPHSYIL